MSTALSLPIAFHAPRRLLSNSRCAVPARVTLARSLLFHKLDLVHRDLGKVSLSTLSCGRSAAVRTSLHSLQMNSAISSMKSPCLQQGK
jgi:hypothetical protein